MAKLTQVEGFRVKQPSAAVLHESEDNQIGHSLATDTGLVLNNSIISPPAVQNISEHLGISSSLPTRGQTSSKRREAYEMSSNLKSGNISEQKHSSESKMPDEPSQNIEAGQPAVSLRNKRRSIFSTLSPSRFLWGNRRARGTPARKLVISAPMDPRKRETAVLGSFDKNGHSSTLHLLLPTATTSLVDLGTDWRRMETVAPRYALGSNGSVPNDLDKIDQSTIALRDRKIVHQPRDSTVLRKAKDFIKDLVPVANVEPSDQFKRIWLLKETPYMNPEDIAKRAIIQVKLRSDESAIARIKQNPHLVRFFGEDPTSIETAPALKYKRPQDTSRRRRFTLYDVDGMNFPDHDDAEGVANVGQSNNIQKGGSGTGFVVSNLAEANNAHDASASDQGSIGNADDVFSDVHQIDEEPLPHVTTTHRALATVQESSSTAHATVKDAHQSIKPAQQVVGSARETVRSSVHKIQHAHQNVEYAHSPVGNARASNAHDNIGLAVTTVGPAIRKTQHARQSVVNARQSVFNARQSVVDARQSVVNARTSNAYENIGLAVVTMEDNAQPVSNIHHGAGSTHKIARKPLPSASRAGRADERVDTTNEDTLQIIPDAHSRTESAVDVRASTRVLELSTSEIDLFNFFPATSDPFRQIPTVTTVAEQLKPELQSDNQDGLVPSRTPNVYDFTQGPSATNPSNQAAESTPLNDDLHQHEGQQRAGTSSAAWSGFGTANFRITKTDQQRASTTLNTVIEGAPKETSKAAETIRATAKSPNVVVSRFPKHDDPLISRDTIETGVDLPFSTTANAPGMANASSMVNVPTHNLEGPSSGITKVERQHEGIKPKRSQRFLKMKKSFQNLISKDKSNRQPLFPPIPDNDGLSMITIPDTASSYTLSFSSVKANQGEADGTGFHVSNSRDELAPGYRYDNMGGLQDGQAHGGGDDYEDWSWFPLKYRIDPSTVNEA